MSTLPYESATSGDRALVEVQRTLAKFGCQSFGTIYLSPDRRDLIVRHYGSVHFFRE